MSDRPKSTPTSPLQLAFRESFLWRLSRPGDAETLRAAGDILFDLLNEAGEWGPQDSESDSIRAELRAAMADLGHILDDLERMAEELGLGEDSAFSDRVSGWAGRLARVVVDMRHQLGP